MLAKNRYLIASCGVILLYCSCLFKNKYYFTYLKK